MIDSSFWDRLRVKKLLGSYLEGFIEYAKMLQDEYNLTDKHIIGVLNMELKNVSALVAAWKKAEPIAAAFSNVPDGDYVGDLKAIELGNAKKGRLQVVFTWEVADGEHAGATQKQFYGLTDDKGNADEKGMGYFKNVTEVIGLDLPEDLRLWQDAFNEFLGVNASALYEIAVKVNGNYANVYVNGVSELTKGTEGEEEVAEEIGEEEGVVEEIAEEVVEEEQVEEVQEVRAPIRKVVAKVVAKPVAKVAAKVAAKPVAQVTKKVVVLARR